jgi:hypothetical protein
MEVDEKPTDTYTDIGGLDKQIEELVEAIVLPMQQAEKFKSLGIKAPKGALMYGPPGELSFFLGLAGKERRMGADCIRLPRLRRNGQDRSNGRWRRC